MKDGDCGAVRQSRAVKLGRSADHHAGFSGLHGDLGGFVGEALEDGCVRDLMGPLGLFCDLVGNRHFRALAGDEGLFCNDLADLGLARELAQRSVGGGEGESVGHVGSHRVGACEHQRQNHHCLFHKYPLVLKIFVSLNATYSRLGFFAMQNYIITYDEYLLAIIKTDGMGRGGAENEPIFPLKSKG